MPLEKNDADPRTPYQLPFPKDALAEIVVPDALPLDERLWVPQAPNVDFRPLCLNPSHDYWMNLLRVRNPAFCRATATRNQCTVGCSRDAGITWSTTGWPNRAPTSMSPPAKPHARRSRWR